MHMYGPLFLDHWAIRYMFSRNREAISAPVRLEFGNAKILAIVLIHVPHENHGEAFVPERVGDLPSTETSIEEERGLRRFTPRACQ